MFIRILLFRFAFSSEWLFLKSLLQYFWMPSSAMVQKLNFELSYSPIFKIPSGFKWKLNLKFFELKKYPFFHINMEKCCFMHFQPKAFWISETCSRTVSTVSNIHVSKAIYRNGQKFKEVSDKKVLGVILDNKLD